MAVRSDRVLLGRMLNNLVENAVRYTMHGSVTIESSTMSSVVRITVRDTGSGIPKADLRRIWQEFEQLQNDARDRRKGLGLGLAIVRRLSEVLDHPVSVTSEPGRGSCFCVDVPLVDQPNDFGDCELIDAVPLWSGDDRLAVVVEDDPALLEVLSQTLQSRNWMVIGCSSREQALTRLRKLDEDPHLILTDYRLAQGETGADVITAIRAVTRNHTPAIILTGEIISDAPGADLPARDAAAIGEVVVLRKPVRAASLMRAIQELTTKSGRRSQEIREPVLCAGD